MLVLILWRLYEIGLYNVYLPQHIPKMTRKLCILFILCGTYFFGAAQFGADFQYIPTNNIAPGSDPEIDFSAYKINVFYWLRLTNYRVEFFPGLLIQQNQFKPLNSSNKNTYSYGFQLPIQVYPFELRSDCKCPTFSKQNDFLKKGFFLQFLSQFSLFEDIGSTSHGTLDLGAGAGIDIGLSDLLTISTFVQYAWNLNRAEILYPDRYWSAGIRLSIRLEENY